MNLARVRISLGWQREGSPAPRHHGRAWIREIVLVLVLVAQMTVPGRCDGVGGRVVVGWGD
jgi:hypothetical protein